MNIFALNLTTEQMAWLTVFVGTLSTAVLAIIKELRANRDATKASAAETAKQIADVAAKADTIKHSVDGTASASVAKIDGLEKKVELLVAQLADRKEAAALLAQAAATNTAAANPSTIVP